MEPTLTKTEQDELQTLVHQEGQRDSRQEGLEALENTIALRATYESMTQNVQVMRDAIETIKKLQTRLAAIRTVWPSCRDYLIQESMHVAVMVIDHQLDL